MNATHKTYKTEQRAYVGYFALRTQDGKLLAPIARTDRPRLYGTLFDAEQAAQSVKVRTCGTVTPVELV